MRRLNPARWNWPEWTALASFLGVALVVLLPSRPTPQDALPVSRNAPPPVPTKTINLRISVAQPPPVTLVGDALRVRASGLPPGVPAVVVNASIDGSPMAGVASAVHAPRTIDADIPVRFVIAGKHAVSLAADVTKGDTRFHGSGQLTAILPEAPPVAAPRIAATSAGIIFSVDAISDGQNAHVIALGQPDHDAVLTFHAEQELVIEGWASAASHLPAAGVLFRIDGGPIRRANLGDDRPDVAKAFATSALEHSGFTARFSTRGLRAGPHQIDVFVVPAPGASAQRAGTPIRFTVSPT